MKSEIHVSSRWGKPFELIRHDDETPNAMALIAITFADKWGMVAAMPDGEDSAGRAKLRLATPDEVAARACQVTIELFEQFKGRGWMDKSPTWEEALQQAEQDRAKRP